MKLSVEQAGSAVGVGVGVGVATGVGVTTGVGVGAGVGFGVTTGVGGNTGVGDGTFFVKDVNVGPTVFKFPLGKVVAQRSVVPSDTSTAVQG